MAMQKFDAEKDESLTDINTDMNCTPFEDSVSSIKWMPPAQYGTTPPNMFACTTWDGSVRIFEVAPSGMGGATLVQKFYTKLNTPVLSCCWNADNTGLFLGCNDFTVKALDLAQSKTVDIGKHTTAVNEVNFVPQQNTIMTTGYDKVINFWQMGNPNPVFNVPLQHKVFVSDFNYPLYCAGMSEEKVMIFDITNINNKSLLDSPLGKESQIQSVCINPDKDTLGIGSIDGRTSLTNILRNPNGNISITSIMTFKSNKIDEGGKGILYPVNSIGFNAKNKKWVFTAGSDGYVQFWDYNIRNNIKKLGYTRIPVSRAATNYTGDLLAYGLGNDFHLGPEGIGRWKCKIGVHHIKDEELKFNKT